MIDENVEEKCTNSCKKMSNNEVADFEGQQQLEVNKTNIGMENVKSQVHEEDLFNKNIFSANFDEFAQLQITDNDDEDEELQPLSERWSPLGADYDDAVSLASDLVCSNNSTKNYFAGSQETIQSKLDNDMESGTRYRNWEEEQELLTTSLLSLTSHFAHVQLRVRQIVEAPTPERDLLLKDLEEFAFRGVPDLGIIASQDTVANELEEREVTDKDRQQFRLIQHLKAQLTELEKLAYESGVPVLPQYMMLEKQKIIIDELKRRLNLRVEEQDLPQLSPDELRCQVDNAFGELMGPLKMRDQLVAQLKTQITDLERFIAFLQCDTEDVKQNMEKFSDAYNSYAAKSKNKELNAENNANFLKKSDTTTTNKNDGNLSKTNNFSMQAHGLLNKASVLMQIFATTHFGTAQNQFQKNTLKKTDKGNHWGDLRAQLEVDMQEVASLAATLSFDREKLANMKCKTKMQTKTVINSELAMTKTSMTSIKSACRGTRHVSSDSDEDELNFYNMDEQRIRNLPLHMRNCAGDTIASISKELTTAVRKNFAVTLQRLIEHGLRYESESVANNLIVPFINCFHPSSTLPYGNNVENEERRNSLDPQHQMHAWELIMEYYYLKQGDEFNNTPARRLMQSFNLDSAENKAVSVKEGLLSVIGSINALHKPYKRSYNAYFKAFVCEGLNCHKLVDWFNIIFGCTLLIERYYMPNSYVVRTGFRDSLRSIDALTKYEFNLPVDLAVRHLRNC